MSTVLRYAKIWLMFAANELQQQFATRVSAFFFFIGKAFRFLAFLSMLIVLQKNTQTLAGYSFDQIIVFFFAFNFIDLMSQILFRGVYMFSNKVRTGAFDFYLATPMNALFRALASHPDFNDVLILVPLTGFFFWYLNYLQIPFTGVQLFLFALLLLNGLLIAMAFHILVLCMGIITTEIDHAIMVYRSIAEVGRFPIEIYREPIRWIVTFIVPVGVMMGFPAQVLLGQPPLRLFIVGLLISSSAVTISLFAWKAALKRYTSASS